MSPPTTGTASAMSRIEVSGLLAMMAAFRGRTPSETELRWWRDALLGFTAAECQAAILAHSKSSPNSITPSEIASRIREARHRKEVRHLRLARDPVEHQRRSAAAARRGMAAIYAATGWTRKPDQAAALAVACPVPGCESPPEVICLPVSRQESRNPHTLIHPSRLSVAQRPAATTEEART